MKKRDIAAGALFCASTMIYGAGFQTLEQGASNLGSALAGATVNANGDATAAFWNPSAAFNIGLEKGETKVDVAANIVISKFDFEKTNAPVGNSGDAGCVSVVPNIYAAHKLTDDIILTLSMSAPFALETNYNEDWAGRECALKSNITTLEIAPGIAAKLNDYISVSAGPAIQWLHAELTNGLPFGMPDMSLTGESWAVGAFAGFTVNYAEDGRIGFQYRSQTSHNIEGNRHVGGTVTNPISCDLKLPHTFTVGWYQRLRGDWKRFAVMAEYAYTMWSCFDVLDIQGSGGAPQQEQWRDTSRVAFGVHFFPLEDDSLVIRLGSAWDQTPIKEDKYRHARIPCTDRIWFSGGVGYKYGNWNFDVAYTYIYFYEDPKMFDNTISSGAIEGYFEGRAHVVAVQAGYKF